MITKVIDEKAIHDAKVLIDRAEHIVVICHNSPDGDAVGSCLAATAVLGELGKDVHTVIPDTCLENLKTLPKAKEMVDNAKYPDFATRLLREADLIICLDFNEPGRTGKLCEALNDSKARKILIDHHLNPSTDFDVVISHSEMSSTCYLLFRVFCQMEYYNFIDRDAATCLLAGMMTDTGNFAYNCSDPELFIVVSELIRKGADKEKLYQQLFNTFSANCMRLNSYAILRKMEVFPDMHAALITLSREELNRYHYTKGDTEGLVNRPLAIPGIVYSCFMREESDCIRVSMRSKGDFPVNILCSDHFGGGGHLNAAGGEFFGTLEGAAETFRSILKDNLRFINKSKKKS